MAISPPTRLTIAAALSAVLILSGCASADIPSTEPDASASVGPLTPVSIRMNFTPSASFQGVLLYGIEQGFYAEEGIDLEVLDGRGSALTAQEVSNGNADFGMVGSPTVAQGVAGGQPLLSVGQFYGRGAYGLIVPDDSEIESFEDLGGHSVLVSTGSPETVFLPAALAKANVDPSTVEIVNVEAAAKTSSFVQGLSDAVGLTIPAAIGRIEAAKPARALPFADIGVGFPDYSLVTRPDFAADNPQLVEGFLRATYKSLAAAVADPEAAVDHLMSVTPTLTDAAAELTGLTNYSEYVCSEGQAGEPVGWHSADEWTAGLEQLAEFGGFTGDTENLDLYFTNEFIEAGVSAETCP